MGKSADDLVEAWRQRCPPTVRIKDVRKVLRTYGFTKRQKRTGHPVYEHPALALRQDLFSHDPHITIPNVKGRYVKKFYIKHLIQAVDVVREWEGEQEAESDDPSSSDSP